MPFIHEGYDEKTGICSCLWCGRDSYRGKAHYQVSRAVRLGKLPNLKAENIKCSDCWRRADRYDHRDYTRPLDVQPVCHRCNRKRGAGLYPPHLEAA